MIKNVISVIDGAVGSCGKAKVVGEIATDCEVNLGAAVTNCMPNAGHSFVDSNGEKTIFRNIPVSIVNPKTELFIGPGSAIDMKIFENEYTEALKYLGSRKIYVHEMVPLIDARHKEFEEKNISTGSTCKGCGAVSSEKLLRYPVLDFFKTYKNAVCCSNDEWLDRLYTHLDNENEYVLLEGAQGCDLDLNHSGNHPYVTCRNVSTTQMLADSGISGERLLQTIMVIRPFPIRINNIKTNGEYAYTGSYGSARELTWSEISIAALLKVYPYEGFIEDTFGDIFPIKPENFEKLVDNEEIFNASLEEIEEDELSNLAEENLRYVYSMIKELPYEYQISIFDNEDKRSFEDELTLVDCLEIERLYHKYKKDYLSKDNVGKDILFYEGEIASNNLAVYHSKILNMDIPDLSEETTVTKKERRVFDLDIRKLMNNCRINTPACLYLNFFQQLDLSFFEKTVNYDDYYLNYYLEEYINFLESSTNIPIAALGTGCKNGERILRKKMLRNIKKIVD